MLRFTIAIGLMLAGCGTGLSQTIAPDTVYVVRTGPLEIHRNPMTSDITGNISTEIFFQNPAYDFQAYVISLLRKNGYTFYEQDHPIQQALAQVSKRGIVEITDQHSTEHPALAKHLAPTISINLRSIARVFTDLWKKRKTREEIIAEYLKNASLTD